MKKIILGACLCLFLVPTVALAATFRATQSGIATINSGETTKNAYLAGNSVSVNGIVTEDLFAAGSTVTVNGAVNDNITAAGNTITLDGKVGKSVRAAGANIAVNNNVGSDLFAAGGTISLGHLATVEDDLSAAGGTIDLNGNVNGNAYLSGGQVTINGKINGNVIIKGNGKVIIGENAIIGGNLNYQAQEEATIAAGAKIKGAITFKKIAKQNYASKDIMAGLTLFSLGLTLATYLLLLALIYLLPKLVRTVVERSYAKPWENLGIGFAYLVVVPCSALILLLTAIGAPISLFAIGLYTVTLGLAKVLVPILVGSLIFKWLAKNNVYRIDWATALIGVIATVVIGMIPIIGWLALFIIYLIALAQFARGGLELLKTQRTK